MFLAMEIGLMATTRVPLPKGQRCELQYRVGTHCYMLLYREGQEPMAREAVAKWARNKDLAFSWIDASAIGEALGYDDPDDCDCCCGPVECTVTFDDGPAYVEPSPFWEYVAATLRVGAVVAPWVAALIVGRWWWGR
jgi:hypothetical protein